MNRSYEDSLKNFSNFLKLEIVKKYILYPITYQQNYSFLEVFIYWFEDIVSYLGRLDQMIYIPLPDEKARLAIIKTVLKECPVANDVDLTYLAKVLVGENGAGVAEICRRACKAAIRESIENKQKIDWPNPDKDSNVADPMDVIRRDHFEKAMSFRGCFAVSDIDIRKYEMFAQIWQSPCGYDSSFRIFNYPQNLNEGGKKL